MTLVEGPRGKFWCDIYLLGAEHLVDGTSKFGATIADGGERPAKPGRGRFDKLDYATAVAIMKHHGKGLLSIDKFFAAAFGVTEDTAAGSDPRLTGLDALRTSKFGLMQAAGNMCGSGAITTIGTARAHPSSAVPGLSTTSPARAVAFVGYWPEYSSVRLGARGRCDHLQLD